MRVRAAVLLWIVLGALFAMPAAAAEVRVLAAASLKEAMDEQARRFEAASGDKVVVSYGASNALAKQIEAGSPADLFISADLDWMDYVDTRRLLAPGTRIDLLRNTLVLIAPAASHVDARRSRRGSPWRRRWVPDKLAMANPDSVPAGKYGKARARDRSASGRASKQQVARAENVRAALVLVARGEAPFGIVYPTDALAERGVKIVDTFPASSHPPIVYPAAVLADEQIRRRQSLARLRCDRRRRARYGRSTASAWSQ